MKLVMVHGRAQGGNDPVALRTQWLEALDLGLTKAKGTLTSTSSRLRQL